MRKHKQVIVMRIGEYSEARGIRLIFLMKITKIGIITII